MNRFVERLRRLDACAVSDACDQLGLSDRVATNISPLTGPATVSGRAMTVELGRPLDGVAAHHLCAGAVDAAGSEDVIVVAHQGRDDCAGWGGNLSRAAKRKGCAATLVDGAVRDVDESRELDYPVFARSATPRTARGRAQEHSFGESIVFAGIAVAPGDYVIADSTGIVFVSQDDLARVLDAAEAIAAKEAAMAAALDEGEPVANVMDASYETMLVRS